MAETKQKPGVIGKKLRLFLLILLALLVPMVMDQAEVDRDALRWSGRVAAGITVLLTLYGLFAKLVKFGVLLLLGLIGLVFSVSEGHLEAPRVKNWFGAGGEK